MVTDEVGSEKTIKRSRASEKLSKAESCSAYGQELLGHHSEAELLFLGRARENIDPSRTYVRWPKEIVGTKELMDTVKKT